MREPESHFPAATDAEPSEIMVTDAILVPADSLVEDTPQLVTTDGSVESPSENGRHLVGRNGKKPARRVKRKAV